MLRVLDLFSGIGGFSLGLERTGGFKTVAFCEIEPFCRKVLAKHWPEVPCYDDVRTLTAGRLRSDGIAVDVICGGFPCQDISLAGSGAGMAGERSGLWSEYARLIGELRPSFVLVENVAALLSRGLDRVLGDLAALGFDAEWHCIPASAVGAPHRRDRVWIVANTTRDVCSERAAGGTKRERIRSSREPVALADAKEQRERAGLCESQQGTFRRRRSGNGGSPKNMAVAGGAGLSLWQGASGQQRTLTAITGSDWWLSEPNVGRVANGVPSRVDRLRGLGNAVVPQIPELIGNAILEGLAP